MLRSWIITLLFLFAAQISFSQESGTLMPFNRWVRSAGDVIRFGDPKQENHALDLAILPDSQHLVLEERYGIDVLDARSRQLVAGWNFQSDPATRALMSTYSGIKAFAFEGHAYIVWGASNTRQSAIMTAEWDGTAVRNVRPLPVEAVAPAATALPNDVAVQFEGGVPYLYVVLNGNNQLLKIRWTDRTVVWTASTGVAPYGLRVVNNKVYVTNWAGRGDFAEFPGSAGHGRG